MVERLLAGSVLEDQIQLEKRSVEEGIERYHRLKDEAIGRGEGSSLKPVERLMCHWLHPLANAIRTEIKAHEEGKRSADRSIYAPAFTVLDPERIALVTMQQMTSACLLTGEVTFLQMVHIVGRAYLGEVNFDIMKAEDRGKDHGDKVRTFLDKRFKRLKHGQMNRYARKLLEHPKWDVMLKVKVGAALVHMAMLSCSTKNYDDEYSPAFFIYKKHKPGKKFASKFVVLTDAARDVIQEGHGFRQFLRPRFAPMIVKPYPWLEGTEGGYAKIRTPFISKITRRQKRLIHEMPKADADRVYGALDAIGETEWQVNCQIADMQQEVWENGGGELGIPRADPIDLSPLPADRSEESMKQFISDRRETRHENIKLLSQRTEHMYREQVAAEFHHYEKFYFPHQFDFRGRVYPIPPHLNHQGDDVCRGLLEFAEGCKVEGMAETWLYRHIAGMYGHDKLPFDEREAWGRDNWSKCDDLLESADKPWQFAAACLASFDDCHIPVQVDGTCNGLQHYSAMLRDSSGAEATNLLPSNQIHDVYIKITNVIGENLPDDIINRVEGADLVEDFLLRSVNKQPIMTMVYKVTLVGARKQIEGKLIDAGFEDGKIIVERDGGMVPRSKLYTAANYLAKAIFNAMEQVCPAAMEAMRWLTECAQIICREAKQPLEWVTPLGFPVSQPYRRGGKFNIRTINGFLTPTDMDDEDLPLNVRKQVNAFAPNFIHSIDATHMMYTALKCRECNIPFSAVHDSYWTTAEHVEEMGVILRETFIELHSLPLLGWLRGQLLNQYDVSLPEAPVLGDMRLSDVRKSAYIFS